MEAHQAGVREGLSGNPVSLWLASSPQTDYPALAGDRSVDVAILGGGIVGLTAALLLKRSGVSVAVLEANRIGTGVTGHTTGKVTVGHGVIYHDLLRRFGVAMARQYAQANRAAIDFIASLVQEEGISCDFHRDFACTYTTQDENIQAIRSEVDAASQLGLSASYAESLPVPFLIKAAIRYENQAFFHARKYLIGLAERIVGDGADIFENTRVRDVKEGDPHRIITDHGTVRAGKVIMATHFPILNRGLFFAKMTPFRSYLLAARVRGEFQDGMYINMEEPTRTLRKHITDAGEVFLIAGGENHHVGHVTDTIARYKNAEEFVRGHFPIDAIGYRWSTQDNRPVDHMPFIGHHSLMSSRVFVATGMQGWGLTNGTVAGRILADMVAGRTNPWQEVFSATRLAPVTTRKFLSMNVHVAKTFAEDRLAGRKRRPATELSAGEAATAEHNGQEVAAFRDANGALHMVSPICVHMGCRVRWNNAERSWDCPCHGSRYDHDGKVLHASANRDLPRKG